MGILAPLLPGGKGKTGRLAQDNRRFSNAVFWILRPGGIFLQHFCRWQDRGVRAMLLEALIEEPAFERLMADASGVRNP